ncbi:hypothetical protein DEU56DRAFT_466846 [Suillus clintonianus]|uniref:uncharacterized protein n=1 Tax=Suillus clintonianus TaxID=1904413 RepID=UPI001B883101|nr:uncharacterized protein DEU56DRAFT_466846 [Suillus clintonianus]KAG2130342.1 hypothetical protein DEU56DRAFT_466846 [Suillus clintonianus]
MPRTTPNHDFTVSVDDGRTIDLHDSWCSPESMQGLVSMMGSEDAARQCAQDSWDQACQAEPFYILGLKPLPNSLDDDVQVHQLFPDYSVRIWGVGLESEHMYHFDFVDPRTGHPVNLPPKWNIFVAPGILQRLPFAPMMDLVMPVGMPVPSMEREGGLKFREILPGEEKYLRPEGTRLRVVSPEGCEAFFEIPVRESIHIEAGQVNVISEAIVAPTL